MSYDLKQQIINTLMHAMDGLSRKIDSDARNYIIHQCQEVLQRIEYQEISNLPSSVGWDETHARQLQLYKLEAIKHDIHIDTQYCWCEPELNYQNPTTGAQVWVHRKKH
jgi:hypothetical protein